MNETHSRKMKNGNPFYRDRESMISSIVYMLLHLTYFAIEFVAMFIFSFNLASYIFQAYTQYFEFDSLPTILSIRCANRQDKRCTWMTCLGVNPLQNLWFPQTIQFIFFFSVVEFCKTKNLL